MKYNLFGLIYNDFKMGVLKNWRQHQKCDILETFVKKISLIDTMESNLSSPYPQHFLLRLVRIFHPHLPRAIQNYY